MRKQRSILLTGHEDRERLDPITIAELRKIIRTPRLVAAFDSSLEHWHANAAPESAEESALFSLFRVATIIEAVDDLLGSASGPVDRSKFN